jgi:hypothetical protein
MDHVEGGADRLHQWRAVLPSTGGLLVEEYEGYETGAFCWGFNSITELRLRRHLRIAVGDSGGTPSGRCHFGAEGIRREVGVLFHYSTVRR